MVTQPGDCALDLNGSKYNSTSNCAWYENAASSNLLSGVKTWSTAVSFSLTHWDVLFDDAMPSINSRLIMEHHTGTLDWMCEHWMEIFWIVVPADSKSRYTLPSTLLASQRYILAHYLNPKGVSPLYLICIMKSELNWRKFPITILFLVFSTNGSVGKPHILNQIFRILFMFLKTFPIW